MPDKHEVPSSTLGTPTSPSSVKSAFKIKLAVQLASLIPVIATVAFALSEPGAISPFVIVGLALLPAVVGFFNWRCPACKVFLGRNLLQLRCRGCDAGLLE